MGQHWYEVSVIDKLAGKKSVQRVTQRLLNLGAAIWLWNPPIAAQLHIGERLPAADSSAWQLVEIHTNGPAQSISLTDAAGNAASTTDAITDSAAEPPIATVIVATDTAAALKIDTETTTPAILKVDLQGNVLTFPVQLLVQQTLPAARTMDDAALTELRVDAALLGQLGQGNHMPVSFNSERGNFERQALGARAVSYTHLTLPTTPYV